MSTDGPDTERLLAEAEADGYVDRPPRPVGPADPSWVEAAEVATPIAEAAE